MKNTPGYLKFDAELREFLRTKGWDVESTDIQPIGDPATTKCFELRIIMHEKGSWRA